jgi:hypothetical protein
LLATAQTRPKGADHDLLKPGGDLALPPEVVRQPLDPLEIGHDDTSGVGEDVRDQRDAALTQDHIRLGRRGAVGSLGDDQGLHALCVVLAELRAHGGRDEDVAGLLEDVGVRDRVGVGEPDNATALGDVSRELTDVEAPRIPDAAVDIGDADDVAGHGPRRAGG